MRIHLQSFLLFQQRLRSQRLLKLLGFEEEPWGIPLWTFLMDVYWTVMLSSPRSRHYPFLYPQMHNPFEVIFPLQIEFFDTLENCRFQLIHTLFHLIKTFFLPKIPQFVRRWEETIWIPISALRCFFHLGS